MSEEDYKPRPVIPDQAHYREKRPLLAEDALKAALNEVTKVKGADTDSGNAIVALRLWEYMQPDDPILCENAGEIKRRLTAVQAVRRTEKLARDSERLQKLIQGEGGEAFGDLQKALGIQNAQAQPAEQEEEQAVLNWCVQKGWVPQEAQQWLLLAMIRRGLRQASAAEAVRWGGEHLSCAVCKKQIWSFSACRAHFTEVKNSHRWETPDLEDLALNMQREAQDETTGGSAVLQRYFGCGGLPGTFSVLFVTPLPPLE